MSTSPIATVVRDRPQVFIAYDRRDFDFVHELAIKLEDARVTVLMPIAALSTAGEDWRESLTKILRSADAVLVVISATSLENHDLVSESSAAAALFREQGRPLVIPIINDEVDASSWLPYTKAGHLEARKEQKLEVQKHLDAFIGPVLKELREREREFIKEAFQHWNIDIGSSFPSQTTADIDPQIFQSIVAIASAVGAKLKLREKEAEK